MRTYRFVVDGIITEVQALNLFDALVAFCKVTNQNALSTHPPFSKLEVSVHTENEHGTNDTNGQDSQDSQEQDLGGQG